MGNDLTRWAKIENSWKGMTVVAMFYMVDRPGLLAILRFGVDGAEPRHRQRDGGSSAGGAGRSVSMAGFPVLIAMYGQLRFWSSYSDASRNWAAIASCRLRWAD